MDRKILPKDADLKNAVLNLNAVRGVNLSKDEKRIDSIVEEIEKGIECDGTFVYSVERNLVYSLDDLEGDFGRYFSQCKYTVYLNPENGARISNITFPAKAKDINIKFEHIGLSFKYKKIKFKVVTGFKYNSDKK